MPRNQILSQKLLAHYNTEFKRYLTNKHVFTQNKKPADQILLNKMKLCTESLEQFINNVDKYCQEDPRNEAYYRQYLTNLDDLISNFPQQTSLESLNDYFHINRPNLDLYQGSLTVEIVLTCAFEGLSMGSRFAFCAFFICTFLALVLFLTVSCILAGAVTVGAGIGILFLAGIVSFGAGVIGAVIGGLVGALIGGLSSLCISDDPTAPGSRAKKLDDSAQEIVKNISDVCMLLDRKTIHVDSQTTPKNLLEHLNSSYSDNNVSTQIPSNQDDVSAINPESASKLGVYVAI